MATTGARTLNTGPLVLRTYGSPHAENVFVLDGYDHPLPDNLLLATTQSGLLEATAHPSFSTLYLSSLLATTGSAAALHGYTISTNTTSFSTLTTHSLSFSTLSQPSLTALTVTVDTAIALSTLSTSEGTMASLSGFGGSAGSVDFITTYVNVTAIPTATLGSVQAQTLSTSALHTTTAQTTAVSTASLSTSLITASLVSTASFAPSSLSTSQLTFVSGTGSSLVASSLYTTNTTLSTLSTQTLFVNDLVNLRDQPLHLTTFTVASTLTVSTIVSRGIIPTQTVMASTLTAVAPMTASTLVAPTVRLSTLIASTMILQTVGATAMTTSSLLTSSLLASTITLRSTTITTVTASSLTTSSLIAPLSLLGTATVSLVTANSATLTTGSTTTTALSTLSTTALTASTLMMNHLTASTVQTSYATMDEVNASTVTTSSLSVATPFLLTQLSATILAPSSLIVSSLTASTVNGTLFGYTNTNLVMGGRALSAANAQPTTTQHTAIGYSALSSLTTGTGNTAIGAFALAQLTSGSYNTAIGYGAGGGLVTGSYNVYVGANARGSASSQNEIVVGGVGAGSHTTTLGNTSTVRTMFSSVTVGSAGSGSGSGSGLSALAMTLQTSSITLAAPVPTLQLSAPSTNTSLALTSTLQLRANTSIQLQGITVTSLQNQTAVGIHTTPSTALDMIGGLRTVADGAVPTPTLSVVSSLGSVGWGVDPSNACGFLTTADSAPLLLQGSSVEIGSNGGSHAFEVHGGGVFQSLMVSTLTADQIVVNGIAVQGNQWSNVSGSVSESVNQSSIQYTAGIDVPTLQATTYHGLPMASATTRGILQPAAGLALSSGVLSLQLPHAVGSITGITYLAGDWFWQMGLTLNTAGFTSNGAWTTTVAGTYRVDVISRSPVGTGTVFLQHRTTSLHSLRSGPLTRVSLSVIVALSVGDELVLFSDSAPLDTTGVQVSAVRL